MSLGRINRCHDVFVSFAGWNVLPIARARSATAATRQRAARTMLFELLDARVEVVVDDRVVVLLEGADLAAARSPVAADRLLVVLRPPAQAPLEHLVGRRQDEDRDRVRDPRAHLRRALHVDVEQHVLALACAPARPPRARSRTGCRAPRPTRAAAPRRAGARRPRGRRSGTRRRPARRCAGGAWCARPRSGCRRARAARARPRSSCPPPTGPRPRSRRAALTQRSAPARGSARSRP